MLSCESRAARRLNIFLGYNIVFCSLSGAVSMQVFLYCQLYPRDRWRIKLMVRLRMFKLVRSHLNNALQVFCVWFVIQPYFHGSPAPNCASIPGFSTPFTRQWQSRQTGNTSLYILETGTTWTRLPGACHSQLYSSPRRSDHSANRSVAVRSFKRQYQPSLLIYIA